MVRKSGICVSVKREKPADHFASRTGSGFEEGIEMAHEHKEYKVSYELTEIFRKTREDLPESSRKIMDDVWDGLQMVVEEINKAADGKSSVSALNDMDLDEALRLAERAAFRRANALLKEELEEVENNPADDAETT